MGEPPMSVVQINLGGESSGFLKKLFMLGAVGGGIGFVFTTLTSKARSSVSKLQGKIDECKDALGCSFDVSRSFLLENIIRDTEGTNLKFVILGKQGQSPAQLQKVITIPSIPEFVVEYPVNVRCQQGDAHGAIHTELKYSQETAESLLRNLNMSAGINLSVVKSGQFGTLFHVGRKWNRNDQKSFSVEIKRTNLFTMSLEMDKTVYRFPPGVEEELPLYWDPASLARFIARYGTHVVTSITVGAEIGHTVTSERSERQRKSSMGVGGHSKLTHVTDSTKAGLDFKQSLDTAERTEDKTEHRNKVQRGGDERFSGNGRWLSTVVRNPVENNMEFVPIYSLLQRQERGPASVLRGLLLERAVLIYLYEGVEVRELEGLLEQYPIAHGWDVCELPKGELEKDLTVLDEKLVFKVEDPYWQNIVSRVIGELFDAMDQDRSGTVSYEELMRQQVPRFLVDSFVDCFKTRQLDRVMFLKLYLINRKAKTGDSVATIGPSRLTSFGWFGFMPRK